MRISTVVFVLKGGKYSLRYLYRKELSEKYEIYRRTKKSTISYTVAYKLLNCVRITIVSSIYGELFSFTK
jgi:hypothetical protein